MDDSLRRSFKNTISKMLHAVDGTRKIEDWMVEPYWRALKEFDLVDVVKATRRAERESAAHVTPAFLRGLIRPTVSAAESKHPALRAEREAATIAAHRATDTPFDLMKREASAAYQRRVNGLDVSQLSKAVGTVFRESHDVSYTGPFDYMFVVNAAGLPRSSETPEHQRAWSAFFRLLSEEWEQQNGPKMAQNPKT